jgi:hypothetical protein
MTEKLDEIAAELRAQLRGGDYRLERGQSTFDIHIPEALQQAFDLGRTERKALREIVHRELHPQGDASASILASIDARSAAEPGKPEPSALPLGHEYGRDRFGQTGKCAGYDFGKQQQCDEPESAHKPKPGGGEGEK